MGRTVLHIILGILLWVVFAYYWYLVFQRPITDHTRLALIIVGSLVAGITLFLLLWILHNRRIARNKNRRKARAKSLTAPDEDFLGRPFIESDEATLKRASYVEISLVDIADRNGGGVHKVLRSKIDVPGPGAS